MNDDYQAALNRLTHTCPIHGGRFAQSACDIRLTEQGRHAMLHCNPVLAYSLADCAMCSGPVPIGSIPRVEVVKVPAPISAPEPEPEGKKAQPYRCQVCGESDPEKFHARRYTLCRVHYNEWQAGKHREARALEREKHPPKFNRQLTYQCQFCGEIDPNQFYGSMKATCKVCHNKRVNARSAERRRNAKERAGKALATKEVKS